MEKYDYFEAVKEDLKQYVMEVYYPESVEDVESIDKYTLYDDAFVSDAVTGNASGSYTFNAWEAEENLCHNMELLEEAANEFGDGLELLGRGAEACDVTIRCYVLGQVIDDVMEELKEELPEEEEEGEE